MPISAMSWFGHVAYLYPDLHLLHGESSTDLSVDAVAFTYQLADNTYERVSAATYMGDHQGEVTLSFKPLFKGEQHGKLFEGLGIHVDTTTGQVKVDNNLPSPAKNNFIIEVTAKNEPDGPTFTDTLRVHIHKSVVRTWITPEHLTVRLPGVPITGTELAPSCFELRAEFEDGVVGNVGDSAAASWFPALRVTGGTLWIEQGDAPGPIPIAATYHSQTAHATAHLVRPWANDPNRPKASVVVGGGLPPKNPSDPDLFGPERVPNVLFVSDGFTASDHEAFNRFTDAFVQHLKTKGMTRPFDLLARSINYWRVFLPAPAGGISVRSEVYTFLRDGVTVARPVEPATKPPVAGAWNLSHLLYAVGLPTPGDSAKSVDQLIQEWPGLVHPDHAAHMSDPTLRDVVFQWRVRDYRAFIDEIDGFPGMAFGQRQAANVQDVISLEQHDGRAELKELTEFLALIESEKGTTVLDDRSLGTLWTKEDALFDFDNANLVVFLSAIASGRPNNRGSLGIHVSTRSGNWEMPVIAVPGRKAFRLAPMTFPDEVPADACRVVAHELGHSFGLGDEYSEVTANYSNQDATLDGFANLQTRKSAERDSTDEHGNPIRVISGDEIKWNWHRITRAALITGPIRDDPDHAGRLIIPVRPGHAAQFQDHDGVLLRVRTKGMPLTKKPDTTRPGQELLVVARTADSLAVEPATAGAVDADDLKRRFGKACIVYVPTSAPAAVRTPDYPYAEMVGLNIKNFMTAQKRGLTDPCPADFSSPGSADLHDFPGPSPTSNPQQLVGLFEGGLQFTCGVFHPTGACMMNHHSEDSAAFCPVCRYVIVDMIDPFYHWDIDRDYAEIYPKP